jgi:thiamine-phosphate pyrophosphorylase
MNQALFDGIIKSHQDLFLESGSTVNDSSSTNLLFTSSNEIYRASKAACFKLGFIDKDAECLGYAWQKMIQESHSFDPKQWPDKPSYFNLQPFPRENAFPTCDKKLGLYVVAPDAKWIEYLAQRNVQTIQLRFKSNDPNLIESEIIQSVAAVKNSRSRLFINDHWELAIKHQAYGVHLGQEDLDIADIKAIRQSGLRLGLSTHGYAEMVKADQYSPSYMALGAVFPTTLKKMETAPQGLGRLYRYAHLMRDYPLVGIGGIDESNMTEALKSGVGSLAVVRAVINAADPALAIKHLESKFIV